MSYFPIQGFAPAAEPTTPGIIVDIDLMVPTLTGLRALPSDSSTGLQTVGSAVRSAAVLSNLSDEQTVYVGTADNLFKQSTTGFAEISSSTNAYSLSGAARWVFAEFNLPGDDRALAAAHGQDIQFVTSGDFADLTGAPKAAFVAVTEGFLMAANIQTSTVGSSSTVYSAAPNRWYCAGINTTNVWDADIATQATTGLLLDTPGGIRALHKLGSFFIFYKERSMYIGRYVGSPQVWRMTLIPGDGLGAPSHHSVVDIETAHLFPGYDDFYLFDGTRPNPIGTNRVSEFFFNDLNAEHKSQIVGHHDRRNSLVYWSYPSTDSADGSLDKFICYNYRSDKWGGGTKSMQFIFEWTATGVTYDDLGALYSTYADLPTAPYDTAFASTTTLKTAVFVTNNRLSALEGSPANDCMMRTWDFGIDGAPTLLTRVRPRFKKAPLTGSQTHIYQDIEGGSEATNGPAATLSDGSFDFVFGGRWHAVRHNYTGDVEVSGIDIQMQQDGEE